LDQVLEHQDFLQVEEVEEDNQILIIHQHQEDQEEVEQVVEVLFLQKVQETLRQ
jgi:hypothetical protein